MYISTFISIENFFKNNMIIRLLFLLFLYCGLENSIHQDTKKAKVVNNDFVQIEYTQPETQLDNGRFGLISSNSKYFFFFDIQEQRALVIKRDDIERVSFSSTFKETNSLKDFMAGFKEIFEDEEP
jgi:hypothetical protein